MKINKLIYIIHAWGETPQSCWYQWLKNELESQGVKVLIPEMPNTKAPDMKAWGETLSNLVSMPNESTFLIGHSIGCQTILRYLETLSEGRKIGGAVFVAPWTTLKNLKQESQQIANPWLETPINWRAAKSHCSQFAALFSDNDEWVEVGEEKIFQNNLGAKTQMMPNMGHFDESTELPELQQLVNAMINNYHGDIIEESLTDKSILKDVEIVSTRVEQVTPRHKTPWLKQWTLHTVSIPPDKADDVAKKLSHSLADNYWYADFRNGAEHYIVFPGKIFKIDRTNAEQYQAAADYGISLGIPDYQVGFSKLVVAK